LLIDTGHILVSTDIIPCGALQLKTGDIHGHERSLCSIRMNPAKFLYLNILTRACASHEGILQNVGKKLHPWEEYVEKYVDSAGNLSTISVELVEMVG
jgi:hypothetical protein